MNHMNQEDTLNLLDRVIWRLLEARSACRDNVRAFIDCVEAGMLVARIRIHLTPNLPESPAVNAAGAADTLSAD